MTLTIIQGLNTEQVVEQNIFLSLLSGLWKLYNSSRYACIVSRSQSKHVNTPQARGLNLIDIAAMRYNEAHHEDTAAMKYYNEAHHDACDCTCFQRLQMDLEHQP